MIQTLHQYTGNVCGCYIGGLTVPGYSSAKLKQIDVNVISTRVRRYWKAAQVHLPSGRCRASMLLFCDYCMESVITKPNC